MAISVETRSEIRERLRAVLKALQPSLVITDDTDEGAFIESIVEAVFGLEVFARAIETDVFPTTALGTALTKHAEARLGNNPLRGATISSGTAAMRVTGTAGIVLPLGSTLTHSSGIHLKTSEDFTVGAGGTVDVDIESTSKGASCNLSSGEIIVIDSPPAGIQSNAVLVGALTGGLDQETEEELRVRLVQAFQTPPAGGRFSDYWAWAMAVDGVASAYVYGPSSADLDGRRGKGTVDVAILDTGTGAARLPSADLVDEVQEYIDDRHPACADVVVMSPGTTSQAVEVKVEPGVGYEWDWTTYGVVSVWDAGNKRITWTTTLPASLTAVVDAGGQPRIMLNGEMLTVTAYGAGGGDDTDLAAAPVTTPVSTDVIYPAGPLTEPVQEAIEELFESLGPARGTAADPEDEWDDELRVAALYDTIMGVAGVRDAEMVNPTTNVVPSDTGGVVYVLVPGLVTVRPL